jgi:hypothetical protein
MQIGSSVGKRYLVCVVDGHCVAEQKMVITVTNETAIDGECSTALNSGSIQSGVKSTAIVIAAAMLISTIF